MKIECKIIHYVVLSLMCLTFTSCRRKVLPDNPDIRKYMDIAKKDISFDVMKSSLPKDLIKKKEQLSKEEKIPKARGNTYYYSTNRNYTGMIRIEEDGNYWSYAGSFFFDKNSKCIAVRYEMRTRYATPVVFSNDWKPQEK